MKVAIIVLICAYAIVIAYYGQTIGTLQFKVECLEEKLKKFEIDTH